MIVAFPAGRFQQRAGKTGEEMKHRLKNRKLDGLLKYWKLRPTVKAIEKETE
jgi:hypothetical protein